MRISKTLLKPRKISLKFFYANPHSDLHEGLREISKFINNYFFKANTMILKNIAKKVVGVLPIGSGIKYEGSQLNKPANERDPKIKRLLKYGGHLIYGVIGVNYIFFGFANGLWTPQQHKQYFETNRIESVQKEKYKQKLRRKLFGENGYADKDGDGKMSTIEKVEFYEKNRIRR